MAAADETFEEAVGIDDGERPSLSSVEGLHDELHRVVGGEAGSTGRHEVAHVQLMVELGAEHDVAHTVEDEHGQEFTGIVDDGEDVALAGRDLAHHLTQVVVGVELLVVALDDGVHRHEREDGVVFVVRHQLSLTSQTHSVDAVGLEEDDGQVGRHGDDHQRQEETVAAGELRDEEDSCQRSVHDAAHQACHTQEREIVLGDEDAVAGEHIP